MRMNPEVEIKELNAVIDQLTERAEKAERERDALAAHVERLSAIARRLVSAMRAYEMDVDDDPPHYHRQMMREADSVLGDTPDISLAALKAHWQAEALARIRRMYDYHGDELAVIQNVDDEIQCLRLQADGRCPDGGTCGYSKKGGICGDPLCHSEGAEP